MLPVAVDAMGGDQAPDVIVAGATRAAKELGVPVLLVGDPDRFDPGDLEVLPASEALKAVAAFRLAMPRTILRFAGGREITLGDLGAKQGILGGINAVIVGNYLTTLGRPAEQDLDLLGELQMPIKALNATL